ADLVEPENDSCFLPPAPPSAGIAALNLAECSAVGLGLLSGPFRSYTAWVAPGVLMRGSQPDGADLAALAALGFRTVVNLRLEDDREAARTTALGMTPVWLPFYDQSLPSRAEVREFLAILDDPARRPVYVHCMQGVGRTGVMVAAYRLARCGFTAGRAIEEARAMGMASARQEDYIRALAKDLAAGRLR
ncbi:MAG: protein-tyrosine phosphatase family protein, partial [Polyangiaceae bacterium]